MSTSKHIDKICLAAVAITLILTILFMNGGALGLAAVTRAMAYESTLFDTSYVHEIDIVMDDWDSFIASCEDEEYASCTVVIDGEKHSNIAIRAKGNTSLSNVSSLGSQRYSFKLEFDHYEDGKTLDGLDKLCLNNLIQDNTMMKDYLVYQMMADFGVDSPLCSFAYLTVNGEDWGLYLAVEGIEDSFLERNYGSDTGELYKPDSMSFGGGRGNGKDFSMDDFDFSGNDAENREEAPASEEMSGAESSSEESDASSSTPAPGGQTMGGSFKPSDGEMPSGDFTPPEGDFNPFETENSEEDDDNDEASAETQAESSAQQPENFAAQPGGEEFSGMSGGDKGSGNMGGGMGSDDVKLKYIDDDPDSYSNIFDNAKTNISDSDKERLIQALKNLSAYTDLEDTLDMDEVLRYFVVHNFVCNGDSYTGSMIHNYYLHENDGKLSMIPWDYNLAFGTFQGGNASDTVNTSIDSPVSGGDVDDRPMLGWIFSDEAYTEEYHALFSEFIDEWFSDGKLSELISETADLIRPYVEKDPTKFCTVEEFEAGVTALTEFVTLRAQAVSNQLAGDDTEVNTGDLNLSDMGTMNTGMGQQGGNQGGMTMPEMNQYSSGSGNAAPEMPNNGENSSTPPEKPDNANEATPPETDGGDSAGGANQESGTVIQTASVVPATDTEASQTDNAFPQMSGSENSDTPPELPDGVSMEDIGEMFSEENFQPGNMPEAATEAAESPWILVGISALVLLIGLVIAIRKKS